MRGRSAHKLKAKCPGAGIIDRQLLCEPFKTATVHIFQADANHGYPNVYNVGGCLPAYNYPSSQEASTVEPAYPAITTYTGSSKLGKTYGFSGESTLGWENPTKTPHIRGAYFLAADLDRWNYRRNAPVFGSPGVGDIYSHPPEIVSPQDPPMYVTGPGIAKNHAFYTIRRRTACYPAYSNYLNWCFTDEAGYMLSSRDGDPTCPVDRLGYSYPAKYVWHNTELNQPFLSYDWWEDNGTSPINQSNPECDGLIPFCTPLDAYDHDGVSLGQYVGYSHIVFFNNNFYVGANDQGTGNAEDPGNLPDDFTSPNLVSPPVKRWKDAHSLDVHIYMVAKPLPGKILKSPRIGSKRFWRPNNLTGYPWGWSGSGICKPSYIYFACGEISQSWGIRLTLNLLDDPWHVEKVMGMGAFNAYMVP